MKLSILNYKRVIVWTFYSTLFNYVPVNGEDSKVGDENSTLATVQTFKEYKEALKKKREAETVNIYKKPSSEDK